MIIGLDASQANKSQKTGVEWYAYHLIQNLKKIPFKKGDKFILYSCFPLKNDLKKMPFGWENKVLNWPFNFFWNQIRLSWELFFQKPDLFFSPGYFPPLFSVRKTVLTVHDLGFYSFKKTFSLRMRIINFLFLKKKIKKAQKIIVPSQFTKNELKKFFQINNKKIVVIPEGYDKKNFYLEKNKEKIDRVLSKYQIKRPYFLFVGRLEERKNVVNLIKAYKQFKKTFFSASKYKMILIGKPGHGYKKFKDEILKIKGVQTLGYISKKDLVYFYNGALGLVFPSFYEGFGLPILEAMASACPVLTSNTSSLPEVGGKACLYFNPKNVKEISQKMKELIKNKNLRKNLIKKGLEQSKKFSWQKCAQSTMKILT